MLKLNNPRSLQKACKTFETVLKIKNAQILYVLIESESFRKVIVRIDYIKATAIHLGSVKVEQ